MTKKYIAGYIDGYLDEELLIAKSVTKATYVSYVTTLKLFLIQISAELKIKPEEILSSELSFDLVRTSLLNLCSDRDWSPSTWNARLAGVKSFIRYLSLVNVEFLELSRRVALLSVKRIPKTEGVYLSEGDIKVVLDSAPTRTLLQSRDVLLVQMLFCTGIRVSELTLLKWEDFKFSNSKSASISILGKGRKNRKLPILDKAVIKNMKDYRSNFNLNTEHIFSTRDGRKMSEDNVRRIVKKYLGKTECDGKITPHTLRHSAATHWLVSGADIHSISAILGHETVTTTEKYLKVMYQRKVDALLKVGLTSEGSVLFKTKFKTNDDFIGSLNLRISNSK